MLIKSITKICLATSTTILLTCSSCNRTELPDEFDKLKEFETELSQMCRKYPEMRCYPTLNVGLADGYVVSISIDGRGTSDGRGRGISRLPKSIYQFQHLMELSLLSTDFEQMPELKPFSKLREVVIEYNGFKGPVHLGKLPSAIEHLVLSRDHITEVIVDDSLPHLSTFDLSQNRMESGINSTFCKLPSLDRLDISFGCCLSDAQQAERSAEAEKILCKKNVEVLANRRFMD